MIFTDGMKRQKAELESRLRTIAPEVDRILRELHEKVMEYNGVLDEVRGLQDRVLDELESKSWQGTASDAEHFAKHRWAETDFAARPMPRPPRQLSVLAMIEECVCRDRAAVHGEAENSFQDIADLASIVLRRKLKEPLDALDAALFLKCLKMGRMVGNPRNLDNLVDDAGYAVCAAGILLAEREADG